MAALVLTSFARASSRHWRSRSHLPEFLLQEQEGKVRCCTSWIQSTQNQLHTARKQGDSCLKPCRHFIRNFAGMPDKKAMLILAEGAEEMEAVISIDVLRRAGVKVTVAGLRGSEPVCCSRSVTIVPDTSLASAVNEGPYDAVILPGGLKGAEALAKDTTVKQVLQEQEKSGRVIAAICAAPIALKSHQIGLSKTVTSYPSKRGEMEEGGAYKYSEDRVVVDGQLITSRGPGTAYEFALAIVEKLMGKEKADGLVGPLLLKA